MHGLFHIFIFWRILKRQTYLWFFFFSIAIPKTCLWIYLLEERQKKQQNKHVLESSAHSRDSLACFVNSADLSVELRCLFLEQLSCIVMSPNQTACTPQQPMCRKYLAKMQEKGAWLFLQAMFISPRSSSKILRCALYFQLSSRCLEMWSNTVFRVWYITSVFDMLSNERHGGND